MDKEVIAVLLEELKVESYVQASINRTRHCFARGGSKPQSPNSAIGNLKLYHLTKVTIPLSTLSFLFKEADLLPYFTT
jgi:hypothetical protein